MQSSLQSSVKFVPDIEFLLLDYKVAAHGELYPNRSEGSVTHEGCHVTTSGREHPWLYRYVDLDHCFRDERVEKSSFSSCFVLNWRVT